jgi:GNAT superfamily N-acetyltransferase
MTDRTQRTYPDEPAGPFPRPPVDFSDSEGRAIEVRTADATTFDALVEMYLGFDPGDRAQGIPPVEEDQIREWLETLFDRDSLAVVAWHDDSAVGHAVLVSDDEGEYELAVFVLGDYQDAGIGTRLLEGLLGLGQREGAGRVWLTVERWNEAAIALYRKLGFETTGAESFELEMSIRLH